MPDAGKRSKARQPKRTAGPDLWGNTQWELMAQVAGVIYDDGLGTSFGVCKGQYSDCSGTYHPFDKEVGEVNVVPEPSSPGYDNFSFQLDDWFASHYDCQCTDPNPIGITELTYDLQYYTNVIVASCNP